MKHYLFLIMNEYRLWGARKAIAQVTAQYPDEFDARAWSAEEANADPAVAEALLAYAEKADMLFLSAHGSVQNLYCFVPMWKRVCGRCPVYFYSTMSDEMAEMLPQLGLSAETYQEIDRYYQAGEPEDMLQMLLCAANHLFGASYPLLPPTPPMQSGIYLRGRKILPPEQEADYVAAMCAETRPVVGVLIHDHYTKTNNLAHVDALIDAIEARGCVPFAISDSFSSNPSEKTGILYRMEQLYRRPDGTPIPASLVLSYGFSLTAMSGEQQIAGQPPKSVFERWNLPVIQAMVTYFNSEEYARDIRGLDIVSLPFCVYQPEFDGQLISVPYAAREEDEDGRKFYKPLPDRVARVAELAHRWAELSRKPLSEKRVAIIFHNMPPRNDTIGTAFGLDSPESVYRVVCELEKGGLPLQYSFESGAQIISDIQAAVTNDGQWLAPDDALRRAAATVDAAQYQTWFARLNDETKAQLTSSWGKAPGTVMVSGGKIIIPGILNGNLFIGLQPMRSTPEKAEELYHSTDTTPPHSYLAFYRWVDEVFGADAVIHVGTHGTLEWLPGKEVGLCSGSYPDICIGGVPNLYIYNINVLGEGLQAKRRSYACILDHMIPSMDESDTYGALTELDEAIDAYYHAVQASPEQLGGIAAHILDLAEAQELLTDLKTTRDEMEADLENGIARLHRWVDKIKTSVVRDGLHIYAQPPEGKLRDQLARLLVRIPNGSVPALNDSILIAQGRDPEALRREPERLYPDGRTAMRIQNDAITAARDLIERLSAADYDPDAVAGILSEAAFPASTRALASVLRFICTDVIPRLDHTSDEMYYLLAGLDGKFVPPLSGGSPSRGNVHILPTGRNFYSIDPAAVPSRAAWEIGQKLAEQAIDAYRAQDGCAETWPESMAMVVYAGASMKTHGEDIAEAFALMGVRPIYLGQSSKVVGVEPIPLRELGRPRIDAVLRISGLFRDTFPNVVELIERAVLCVSALDEAPEDNFVKKHSDAERKRLISEGISENDAAEQANLRVFGCPAGTYGAGVNKAIQSRNWENWEDLAKLYKLWGCHAYSSHIHGKAMPDVFASRLSTVRVAIKNESSVEGDMLDSDDYYNYHGGLIACVRANSGEKPLALAGQTADPARPETASVETELARVMRSRILNPKWVSGLKRHGYKGAQDIAKTFDVFFGWDATAEVAENWMYTAVAEHILLDEETRKWMEEVNPAAVHHMSERFLEAEQRGMWQADEQTLDQIRQIYMNAEGNMEELFN